MTFTRFGARAWAHRLAALAGAGLVALASLPAFAVNPFDPSATISWGAPVFSAAPTTANRINNQTLRQIVHLSVGGTRVRVKLSNRWGPLPLDIGAAQVAVRSAGEGLSPGTSRTLTFSGNPVFSIPAGAEITSDWVDLSVADGADLAIDTYLPGDTSATGSVLTVRTGALQTSYLSNTGNFVGSTAFPTLSTRLAWNFLGAVDVAVKGSDGAVIAFGDSITEGLRSTADTNRRWPDVLARRLVQVRRMGVADLGISGNRVGPGAGSTNPSALARIDQDVLTQTGATHVIVLLGINDANGGTSAEDIIAALQQVAIRARTQQLKIFAGTVTPYGNGTDIVEAKRQQINQYIRTSRDFDGYVDFDAAIRDPDNPRRMLPAYDSGDTLHPSDAGYEAMGNAVNLDLLR